MGAEVMAGRGPLYLDVTEDCEFDSHFAKDDIRSWMFKQGTFFEPERLHRERGGGELRTQKSEWTLRFVGRLGSVKVDLDCKSTELENLWAAGDTIMIGCALSGAMSANAYGRWGLPFAFVTGLKAAKDIVKVVAETPEPKTTARELERLRARLFAPMAERKRSLNLAMPFLEFIRS